MDPKEISYIKNCQQGKLEDFTPLYDLYVKKIYDFIYYKTYHRETAEDLVSLVFVKALENINSFDFAKGSFSAWLYRIAQNTVIDHWRTKKNEANVEDIWDLAENEDLETDLDNRQQLEEVRKYLKKIKSKQREIVMLRLWQQLSYKEIAEISGLTEANCKMTYSRVMRTLKQDMPVATFLLFIIFNIFN